MPTETTETIVREIDIEASAETIFEFFVDPEKITRWLALEAELDPRPGGVCYQVHEGAPPDRGRFHMRGEFIEVDPPKRVIFSWGFENSDVGVAPGTSTVEVTLSPNESGTGTRVMLVHRGLPPATISDHSGGWTTMLDRLAKAVRESGGER
ncbi:SRPBCC family protein [Pseudonocardia acaciae]|uniref:SRPBCC family protein n=1 Tax=Pseudonocardia acaciae TaxID=551276 RepID=UPI0006860EFF|nr:SRPBCC domain-containing protein [Pseudonocardia acaciae]